MPGHVRVGGSWKTVASPSVRVGGSWKSVTAGFTRVGGAWKQWYTAVQPGTYELLETQILTGTQSSVIFSSLDTAYAGTYKNLQLRVSMRGTRNENNTLMQVFFNSNENYNNYSFHLFQGSNSAITFGSATNYNSMDIYGITSNTSAANAYGAAIIDIVDAFQTTKNKTIKVFSGFSAGTPSSINLTSGQFLSTSAISSIHLEDRFASIAAGSRFSLYGVRTA
jgi:hypothetical protein